MKGLSRLLGTLLALALVASAGAWVFGQTFGDEHYLVQWAAQANVAGQLAGELPTMLANLTTTPDNAKVVLVQAITPGFVQDQIESFLPQLTRYYMQNGPVPQLDLRDLDARIKGAGFEMPAGLASTLDNLQPVTAGRLDGALQTAAHGSQQLSWLGPLVAVVLAGLVVLVARGRRWLVLAGSAVGAAVGVVLLAAAAYLPPPLISSTLSTSLAKPLEPAARSLADVVAHDQSQRLLWVAAGLAGLAAGLVLIHVVLHLRHKFGQAKKEH